MTKLGATFNKSINVCVDDQVPHPTPSLQNNLAPLYVLSLEENCLSSDHNVFLFYSVTNVFHGAALSFTPLKPTHSRASLCCHLSVNLEYYFPNFTQFRPTYDRSTNTAFQKMKTMATKMLRLTANARVFQLVS